MQVTVTINTVQQQFAGGTVGGDWLITFALSGDPGTIVQSYQGPAPSTTQELTDGATYAIIGQRLDAGGNPLGPMAQAQYTVGTELVTVDVADSLSITAAPTLTKASSRSKK